MLLFRWKRKQGVKSSIRMSMKPGERLLAEALASHIIADKESSILRNLITKDFKYEKLTDIEAIEGYCKQSLVQESELEGLPLLNSSPSQASPHTNAKGTVHALL